MDGDFDCRNVICIFILLKLFKDCFVDVGFKIFCVGILLMNIVFMVLVWVLIFRVKLSWEVRKI